MINLLRKKLPRVYKENVAHSLLWLFIFFIPVAAMSLYDSSTFRTYSWTHIFSVWTVVFIYFGAFLVHNFFFITTYYLSQTTNTLCVWDHYSNTYICTCVICFSYPNSRRKSESYCSGWLCSKQNYR